MVRTPWFAEEIPFEDAAKIGTLKVIKEHATIGVVVTTDGSFGEIDRHNYIGAEEQTITEMEETEKPYIILLNSERPYSAETEELRMSLEEKYGRPVIAVNCKQMQKSDIVRILESVLLEFPITTVEFFIPKWTEMLENEHPVKKELIEYGMDWLGRVSKMRDLYEVNDVPSNEKCEEEIGRKMLRQDENEVCIPFVKKIRTADGTVELRLEVDDKYYYDYLSGIAGEPITSEYQLIHMIRHLSNKKQEYEKVEDAMNSVNVRGYGVVAPALSDIVMEEPELITHAGKFGVKIRATSPSIHMIRANIETEIAPIVGNKEQAEDLITYIKDGEYSEDGVWGTNIFGKSLGDMMEDGIRDKISKMDDECQMQLQNTMQKVVNDNNGGLVCIII
jgi:stage IV sporulation protein A